METSETRQKLADAIKQLQAKGDTPSINRLVSAYKNKYQTPQITETAQDTQPQRGIVGSALNTLLVKPAARFAEAVGRTGILGQTIKTGYEEMVGQNQELKLPGAERALGTVEPQKSFGEGGGVQIFSDALQASTYLAPYGKVAGIGSRAATTLGATDNLARIVGGATAGAAGGYATDVAQGLNEGKRGEAFIPGFGVLIGGLTGGALEGAGVAVEKISKGAKELGKELEQQTFKLTPTQRSNLGTKLDDLTKFSAENIPAGSPEQRLAHADDLYQHYEEQLQAGLESKNIDDSIINYKTNKPKVTPTYTVNKNTFIKQLQSIKGSYKYDRDFQAINNQIEDAINTIKTQYKGDEIPVDKLNIFKRSTYQNAFNKAGNKVSDVVEYDIADRARVAIERATKGLKIGDKSVGEFNKEYGNLIQLRKILKLADGRPELGFTKRIMARIVGGLVGSSLGGIPGLVGGELLAEPIANQLAGTSVKTSLSKKLMAIQPKKVGSVIQRLRP